MYTLSLAMFTFYFLLLTVMSISEWWPVFPLKYWSSFSHSSAKGNLVQGLQRCAVIGASVWITYKFLQSEMLGN
jgi:hypothetical protein